MNSTTAAILLKGSVFSKVWSSSRKHLSEQICSVHLLLSPQFTEVFSLFEPLATQGALLDL